MAGDKQKAAKPHDKPKDLAYNLVLFKIEGHTTWRAVMNQNADPLENDRKNWGKNAPRITDRKNFRIDRITGEIKQV